MGLLDRENKKEEVEEKSDEEILALSIQSPSLFAILVERYQDAFLRKAQRVLRDHEEAQDLVQESFTKIYMNAGKFKEVPGASFKSWGYKILLNTAFTRYQKLKRGREVLVRIDEELKELFPDTKESFTKTQEVSDYVASIISRMPQALGHILKLHFLEDKSQKEIAETEGMSVGAVKTRIHRAKKEFKRIEPHLVL